MSRRRPDPEDPGAESRPEWSRSDGLREPRARNRYIRSRRQLTVRELMEQLNTPDPDETAAAAPPRRPQPGPPPGADDLDYTTQLPPVPDSPNVPVDLSDDATAQRVSEESRGQAGPGPLPPSEAPPRGWVSADAPAPPENAPTPTDGAEDPAPSDAAPESRAAARRRREAAAPSAAEPLQPTPDLTPTLLRSGPRRIGRRRAPATSDPRVRMRRTVTATGRVVVTLACIIALVSTGLVWNYLRSWNGNWNTIAALLPGDEGVRKSHAQLGDETYLIVGTDTRAGENANVGAGGGPDFADGSARSDTVILVNIPADRSRVVAVSFPRDLQVDRPECEEWDNDAGTYGEAIPAATDVKLNGVYAAGGPTCLVKVLTKMSGLNINHFIAMDFYGFEQVVNTIGGVEVCSTTPLYDYQLGQIKRRAGVQTLTGRRALNYVRARNISTEGNGDYGRIKRQQLFLSSLMRSTLSGDVLTNPGKLNSLVNTFIEYSFVDNVDTDSLLDLADSMQGLDAGRVTFLTIPTSGTSTDGMNNEIPRMDDVDAIFNAIIDDTPLPGEAEADQPDATQTAAPSPTQNSADRNDGDRPTATTQASATALSPANVSVRILNGTGRPGAAADVSDQLYAEGFDVGGIADASEYQDQTVVRYGPGEQDAAATLARMLPNAAIQEDRTVRVGVEIILGSDFPADSVLSAVPATGSTLSVRKLPAATNAGDLPNDLSVTNAGAVNCE